MDKNLSLLQSSLGRLNGIYERLKSLDQWNKLKQDEFGRQPLCNIKFAGSSVDELSNIYCDFVFAAQQSFDVLNSIEKPSGRVIQLKKQIDALCCKIYYFGSGINFY